MCIVLNYLYKICKNWEYSLEHVLNYYKTRVSYLTLVNSQQISGENASAVFGTNATLKWNITKSNGFSSVTGLQVFRGKRAHEMSLLIEHTEVKDYAKEIFHSRLSLEIIGYEKDAYIVTITDVRYSDSGFFNLAAIFQKPQNLSPQNATIRLSVKGKPSVFSFLSLFIQRFSQNSQSSLS